MIEITAKELEQRIFETDASSFNKLALEMYQFQFEHNPLYRRYAELVQKTPGNVSGLQEIPFLPISFFKQHKVASTTFSPQVIFESSGSSYSKNSRHFVKDASLYTQSFSKCFSHFYPGINCILALLPNYLEKGNSSLVFMADHLIKNSGYAQSGFFLHDHDQMAKTLLANEQWGINTLLIGVTYALLDFFEAYPMPLVHTTIMETGGMKGRREELTRERVHELLKMATGLHEIHSEYGMTELLSQAYAKADGLFSGPAWMKMLIRQDDDPFDITETPGGRQFITGALNVIDLANLYSCAFIATDDVGKLYHGGKFEVLGRLDNSDMRGCSLMYL